MAIVDSITKDFQCKMAAALVTEKVPIEDVTLVEVQSPAQAVTQATLQDLAIDYYAAQVLGSSASGTAAISDVAVSDAMADTTAVVAQPSQTTSDSIWF